MGLASERGKAGILLTVTKQPNTSTLDLTGKLDKSLEDLQKVLPKDVKVTTDIFRQSRFINNSIDNVQKSLYEGGIFVIIVLLLFLMNIRTTVISLITIPLSVIVAILTLKALGLTINTMSLGGIAIAIGSGAGLPRFMGIPGEQANGVFSANEFLTRNHSACFEFCG